MKSCIEYDQGRCDTLRRNRPRWNVIPQDIRGLTATTILKKSKLDRNHVSLVVGGPPCQPFSKAAFWVPDWFRPYKRDARAILINEFARLVIQIRPRAFVMENVAGLAYSTNRRRLDQLIRLFRKKNYTVSWKILNAADYGAPQRRERIIVVGSREEMEFAFPRPTHGPNKVGPNSNARRSPFVTSGKAIGDLDGHEADSSERVGGKWGHLLDNIPPGQNYLFYTEERGYPKPIFAWRSRYWSFLAKLSPKEPSWTISSSPGPYTGPFHWRNRRLRLSEVKRLQTFPDSWIVSENPKMAQKWLGDATPPLLAECVGRSLMNQFFS